MKNLKTILMVAVVAAALVAIPASAQTSSSGGGNSSSSDLTALVESQQLVIGLQQSHIDSLEALVESQKSVIEAQQALLDADLSHLATGQAEMDTEDEEMGAGPMLPAEPSAEEMADAAVICAGWLAERDATADRRARWAGLAAALEQGTLTTSQTSPSTIPSLTANRDQVLSAIPLLTSERIIGLMTATADSIDEIINSISAGESSDLLAQKITAGIERLDALDAVLAWVCDVA